jgi:hypothetical protein
MYWNDCVSVCLEQRLAFLVSDSFSSVTSVLFLASRSSYNFLETVYKGAFLATISSMFLIVTSGSPWVTITRINLITEWLFVLDFCSMIPLKQSNLPVREIFSPTLITTFVCHLLTRLLKKSHPHIPLCQTDFTAVAVIDITTAVPTVIMVFLSHNV